MVSTIVERRQHNLISFFIPTAFQHHFESSQGHFGNITTGLGLSDFPILRPLAGILGIVPAKFCTVAHFAATRTVALVLLLGILLVLSSFLIGTNKCKIFFVVLGLNLATARHLAVICAHFIGNILNRQNLGVAFGVLGQSGEPMDILLETSHLELQDKRFRWARGSQRGKLVVDVAQPRDELTWALILLLKTHQQIGLELGQRDLVLG